MRQSLFLLCLTGFLLFGGCARQGVDPSLTPADPASARDAWNRFEAVSRQAEAQSGPFRINATLYYAGKEGSQRVTVYFWGDNAAAKAGKKASFRPLRLDILMGPGSVMGKVVEDGNDFIAYVPRDETAYRHTGDDPALPAFGVPVPFSLADLSLLLTGQFQRLFAEQDARGHAFAAAARAWLGKDGLIAYAIGGRLSGLLELSPDGLPRVWHEQGGKGWTLTIDYWDDSTRTTPRKLHVAHPQGAEATLVVRELARPGSFTPKQLELAIPPGTRFAPLRAQAR